MGEGLVLINAGADVRRVRQYLEQYAGDLVAIFDGLVEEALEGSKRRACAGKQIPRPGRAASGHG